MCKHHKRNFGPVAPRAYEGQTVQLSGQQAVWPRAERMHRRQGKCTNGVYGWWMLWLIWPLVALAKALVPTLVIVRGAVLAQLSLAAPFSAVLVAVALIALGVVMIRQR